MHSRKRWQRFRVSSAPDINGAFYAMVRLPVDSAEDFCRWMLDEFEHEGKTVMLAPGAGFYATPGQGIDQVPYCLCVE